MSAILNSLNVYNFPIFQPILMKIVSKFMVYRAVSDKTHFFIRIAVPFKPKILCFFFVWYLVTVFSFLFIGIDNPSIG